jgi:hypothetical protein
VGITFCDGSECWLGADGSIGNFDGDSWVNLLKFGAQSSGSRQEMRDDLATQAAYSIPGMSVYVTSDFQPDSPLHSTVVGEVVRIDKLETEKWGVAIRIVSPSSTAAN